MTSYLVLVMVQSSMAPKISLRCGNRAGGVAILLVFLPFRLANDVANLWPDRCLGNEIGVRVRDRFPSPCISGYAPADRRPSRCRRAVWPRQRATPSPNWEYSFNGPALRRCWSRSLTRHRLSTPSCIAASTFSPAPGFLAMQQAPTSMPKAEVQSGAGITDLCTCHQRHAIAETGGRRRTAGALRHVLINLAVFVRTRTKTLDRCHDHFRDSIPGYVPS